MRCRRCLFALSIIVLASHQSGVWTAPANDRPFWLTADLLDVQWRKGCLTTAGCAEPRLLLSKHNTVTNETISTSWPVTSNVVKDDSRQFTTHWNSGSPETIVISCEIIGVDPTYKFPRICDSTNSFKIYTKNIEGDNATWTEEVHADSNDSKFVIELRAKCYNATVSIERYDVFCPWCSDHGSINIIEQYTEPDVGLEFLRSFSARDQFFYALMFLAAFCAILTTSFACLLIAFLFQKRRSSILTKKQNHFREQIYAMQPLRTLDHDKTRYDVPWDDRLQCRPMPIYHPPSKSIIPFSTMAESRTVASGSLLDRNSNSRGGKNFSPNSSFGERHDDSGLESV